MEDKNPLNPRIIALHIEHLRYLDMHDHLILCGPFKDHSGGMVIFKAQSKEEAETLAKHDPFIAEGYKTYVLRTIELADASNGYLG
ncbi:MAG: hypothetical protein E4G74_00525 [Erysipelotrichales bacterium]|nr:MAG: hypothetical protein E4G74_00525 [Erysipelotrichales bacterium]